MLMNKFQKYSYALLLGTALLASSTLYAQEASVAVKAPVATSTEAVDEVKADQPTAPEAAPSAEAAPADTAKPSLQEKAMEAIAALDAKTQGTRDKVNAAADLAKSIGADAPAKKALITQIKAASDAVTKGTICQAVPENLCEGDVNFIKDLTCLCPSNALLNPIKKCQSHAPEGSLDNLQCPAAHEDKSSPAASHEPSAAAAAADFKNELGDHGYMLQAWNKIHPDKPFTTYDELKKHLKEDKAANKAWSNGANSELMSHYNQCKKNKFEGADANGKTCP